MPETSCLPPTVDPADHLPLSLLIREVVPPAPTRSASAIDWIPDFAGYSWVAYGASSLLVISHFPSPLSPEEALIGPILRQVFELSGDQTSPVSAVSWSPVTPSVGELAAASENHIFLFSHDSASSTGSFSWSQNAVLVQSSKVEAIKWSSSGDGIISGGMDVVLWRRRDRSWEIAWKFKRDEPQNLVSATWSIEGLSASAGYLSELLHAERSDNTSKSVLVCYGDGMSEYTTADLHHPQPVCVIQWRPLTERHLQEDTMRSPRQMLLTCCLDGAVRLWTEVDNGKVRKPAKEYDCKIMRRSFCVAAVIEINQALSGTLGMDIFLTWATETGGIYKNGEADSQIFSAGVYDDDKVGKCEWLIGFGPGTLISFWAIHCLDDISPTRFPRVTLWKRQELQELEMGHLQKAGFLKFEDSLLLNNVVILRTCLSGPPNVCSLLNVSPCNSLVWSLLYTQKSHSSEASKLENCLSCSNSVVSGVGHTGSILQLAMHPQIYEVELAVSLDSNGLLLFWLVSTIPNCNAGLLTLIPSWKLCGKKVTREMCASHTSLTWAPSSLREDLILLVGHHGGIDCFLVKGSHTHEADIICHFLCTIPMIGHGPYKDGPTDMFAIPMPPTCNKTFKYNKFLLLGVWMMEFHALSWEVTLHSYDLPRSCCECNFDGKSDSCFVWKFEKTFASRVYCIGIKPCSSQLPEPHSDDQITSFSVVFPGNLIPKQESLGFNENLCHSIPAYTMATGCSDGSVKLWKCNPSNLSTPSISWELVGKFGAHQGPISSICLADTGRKVATICNGGHLDGTSIIHIWDTVHLMHAGSFILEDTLSIDGDVITLNWLTLGNGQLVLGVCLQNELQVYAQKCSGGQILLSHEKSFNLHNWSCIAVAHNLPAVRDFYWGPQSTAVIVHDSYFSIVSPWLFLGDNAQEAKVLQNFIRVDSGGGKDKDIDFPIFADCDKVVADLNEPIVDDRRGEYNSATLVKVKVPNDKSPSSLSVGSKQNNGPSDVLGFWNLAEVAEQLRGILPIYHPQALLMNIYSGNWKRAYVSVRHLVECLTLRCASEKSSGKRGHIIPQILLSNYFEGIVLKDSTDNGFQWTADARLASSSSQFLTSDPLDNVLSSSAKSEHSGFVELIEKLHDSTATEKLQILAIIDLLSEVQHSVSAYKNLDELGRRFWVTLRFQQLHFVRSFGRLPSVEELCVDTRLMSLAFHSDCHETLLSFFLPNEPSWKDMRTLGVGFWFTSTSQLRAKMEKLARNQYLRNKDPKDCALLYIALNRLQVLAGLFKISKDEKDRPLVGFLSRNFQEEKNKAAALKNAYVLMGRHQLELAIAFFLLGGDTYSAITVCVRNLGDEQLALVICRLLEGHGGPLEHQLITKFIAPSARQRGDYWLASLLEWELGNYVESFLSMLDLSASSVIHESVPTSNHVAFVDPLIGLYCLSLAAKSSMRNAIGDQNAAILGGWATFMAATAFSRSGLPLEALECLSSPLNFPGTVDHGSGSSVEHPQVLNGILKPSTTDSSNWLSGEVALHLEFHAKLDLALQYFSKLMIEHPGCPETTVGSLDHAACSNVPGINQYDILLESFRQKLYTGLSKFEQKFLLACSCIIKMLFGWMCNNGLWFIGYDVLLDYICQDQTKDNDVGKPALHTLLHGPISKAIEDVSLLLSRFITCCGLACFQSKSSYAENGLPCSYAHGYAFQGIMTTLGSLKAAMDLFAGSFSKDVTTKPVLILDIFEYCVHIALAWLQQDLKSLLLMVKPVLISCTPGHTPYEVDMVTIRNTLHHGAELLACQLSIDDAGTGRKILPNRQDGNVVYSFSDEEKWLIIGTCLWQHLSRFVKHKLHFLSMKLEESYSLGISPYKVSPFGSSLMNLICDSNSITEQIESSSLMMVIMLNATVVHVSSHHARLFQSFLQQKLEKKLHIPTLAWVKDSGPQTRSLLQEISADVMNHNCESTIDFLWNTCADPNIICEACPLVKISWSHLVNLQSSKGWMDMYKGISEELKIEETSSHEGTLHHGEEVGPPARGLFTNGPGFLSSWQRDATITNKVSHFQSAKEIYKRDGELLEALCINSINEGQAALASNRKGIIFFSWGDVSLDQSEYIWSDADWPLNGWAGTEPTPVPTCVSPGVGLGSKRGSHLGLGGATIGMDSLARPRKDLPGGGAFGIPGYAGIGATSIGWEIQEDFEDTVDPPATVENIRTTAFSGHPSRPFFLVGSSNTHIYLWEFDRDKATATYGVLPAANVPPPYALASVSALQFDHCGHRFASAALDGTVCTWQLEVGGRSNIHPTESSICFNGHASDVAYVGSSGSVIAAAGYSSNGVNAIIWDTLAPPTTSQASIICHEGGARSISVFNNDIGSGSISPLIVTGGKSGDVGLHDFRYIATGKTKRHRHFDNGDTGGNTSSSSDMRKAIGNKSGDQNLNGMLWYIPKAHLGSVTKISTIPHTSLFLTGSKDGDVKLWDAKAAKMIYHWPKLHDRHTFLQPSSRGYGGVVRAAVTDIQVVSRGFLTCGGDGCVKLVQLQDYRHVHGI